MGKEYVMQDMRKSMAWLEKAKPIIADLLRGGKTIPVEGDDNEVCRILDMTCGTDYIHVYADSGLVVGVASRIQDMGRNWRTFTVRKERESGSATEWEKRKTAIKRGGIYPLLTMQGYVVGGQISGLAIVKTVDLMLYVDEGHAITRHTGADQNGQASFFVCPWDDMRGHGIKVLEFRA